MCASGPRRVAEVTFMLQPLGASEREAATTRLIEQPRRFARSPGNGGGATQARRGGGRRAGPRRVWDWCARRLQHLTTIHPSTCRPRGSRPMGKRDPMGRDRAAHPRIKIGCGPRASPSRPSSFSFNCRCRRTSSQLSSNSCRRHWARLTRCRSSRPLTDRSGLSRFQHRFFDPREGNGHPAVRHHCRFPRR